MLEALKAKKEKPEDDAKVKVKAEDAPSTPSPAKRMATELEKKMKTIPGDLSLVKARVPPINIQNHLNIKYLNFKVFSPFMTCSNKYKHLGSSIALNSTCSNSTLKELLDFIMGFTAEGGNLDCLHPAQAVVDCLCGDSASN